MCRADNGASAHQAVLAATAATGLVKLLVAGAAEPESGLEHGDMVKVWKLPLEAPRISVAVRVALLRCLHVLQMQMWRLNV